MRQQLLGLIPKVYRWVSMCLFQGNCRWSQPQELFPKEESGLKQPNPLKYTFNVKGKSAHAGNHHDKGISAIRELAQQVVYLESLTDYALGTTVNVGVIQGGSRPNVVPELATASIDVRVATMAEAERIDGIIKNLRPHTAGISFSVKGGLIRPPMERSAQTVALLTKAKKIAKELGFELSEAAVGGGSDGNFTAAAGIPTLDGLGAVGDNPHAENEHVLISSLVERAALLAHLIKEI